MSLFNPEPTNYVYVSRQDPNHILASYSKHAIELDGAEWPSAEHYYQAMKFEDEAIREQVRLAPDPFEAVKIAKKHKRNIRKDWKKIKVTIMTRGLYIKCRTYNTVSTALQKTKDRRIVERSQYDYFWGCGRDGRGDNVYGKVLMDIRNKLAELE